MAELSPTSDSTANCRACVRRNCRIARCSSSLVGSLVKSAANSSGDKSWVANTANTPRCVEPAVASGFTVNFVGFPGPTGAEDRGHPARLDRDLLLGYSLAGEGRFYEITVRRSGMPVGRVVLDLGPGGDTP